MLPPPKQPELHVIAGPNGAGKSTLYEHVLSPSGMQFVNADVLAARYWPNEQAERAYDAAQMAGQIREDLIASGRSFVTETVFSHESKLDLLRRAALSGYIITLHVIIVPEDLAVARVRNRVQHGGHAVPESKIRSRYQRLWKHVAEAIRIADDAYVYDNSSLANAHERIAHYQMGQKTHPVSWPTWAPADLVAI